jgi:hypothetical protein
MTTRIALFVSLTCAGFLQAQSYDQQLSRSRSALNAKQYREAQIAADAAIQLDPNRWEGYVLAANAYSSQRLYDDAIGMLQIALPRAPEDKKILIREALTDVRKQSAAAGSTTLTTPPNSIRTGASAPTQVEIVLWKTIENSSKEADFRAYLDRYPEGTYVPLATARMKTLSQRDFSGVWACSNQRGVESDLWWSIDYRYPHLTIEIYYTRSATEGFYRNHAASRNEITVDGTANKRGTASEFCDWREATLICETRDTAGWGNSKYTDLMSEDKQTLVHTVPRGGGQPDLIRYCARRTQTELDRILK